MADIVRLGDVSTKDTCSGSQLKTGGRRKHNMPKDKEKIRLADKAKRSKCKGKTGAALTSCLKSIGRVVGKTGEWEKIRSKVPSSDY